MRFEVDQRIDAPALAVRDAYLDPDWYQAAAGLPRLGAPEVLRIEHDDDHATSEIRYRFTGDLAPAVTAVVDPRRLTWVEHTRHDLATATGRFELRPDHYAGRLTCQGDVAVTTAGKGKGASRLVRGDLRVRFPLVGGQVERAIVSGLREHLEAEAELLERWLAERA